MSGVDFANRRSARADLFDAYAQLAAERGKEAPRALLRDNALRFYGAA